MTRLVVDDTTGPLLRTVSADADLASRVTSIVTDVSNFADTYAANGNRASQLEPRPFRRRGTA